MNKQELLKLYDIDLEELISKEEKITNENFPKKEIEVCSIISAKTGKCVNICSESEYNALKKTESCIEVDKNVCAGCSLCLHVCPQNAITMRKV